MQQLIQRIQEDATYLGKGIVKVDSFLNHQIVPQLTAEMGRAFANLLAQHNITDVTKVLTAEVSGIAPAMATGTVLGVPVVFARKKKPITMQGKVFSADTPSRTKGNLVTLRVSAEFLESADNILIIDDFLATGKTLAALAGIVAQAGATLRAIGCVIEKPHENGRLHLSPLGVPIFSLAKINIVNDKLEIS